jgi:hypothetical protein
VDARDDWRRKLESLKQGKYNKPHWLRYIRRHEPPGPTEEEVHSRTGHEDPKGEKRYNSTLSLTSALDGVGGQRQAPAALTPGKR